MSKFRVGDVVTYNDAIAPGEVVGLQSGLVDVHVAGITYYGMHATDLTLVSRPDNQIKPWIPTPGTRVNTPMGTGVIIPNEEGGSNISMRLDSGAGTYVAYPGSKAVIPLAAQLANKNLPPDYMAARESERALRERWHAKPMTDVKPHSQPVMDLRSAIDHVYQEGVRHIDRDTYALNPLKGLQSSHFNPPTPTAAGIRIDPMGLNFRRYAERYLTPGAVIHRSDPSQFEDLEQDALRYCLQDAKFMSSLMKHSDKRETGQGIVKMPIKPLGRQRLQTTLWDPMDDTFLEDA